MSDVELARHYSEVRDALNLRRDLVSDIDEVESARRLGLEATIGYPKGALPTIPSGPYSPNSMSRLYDSMYSRIIPYSASGILWYQGESNTAEGYLEKYLLYMRCMKESFKNPNLCFYAVELASYGASQISNGNLISDRFVSGDNWAFKREAQQKATEIAPDNYLVTSMGLGDVFDIHPANKKDLSHRIAIKVLKHTYGFDVKADQPVFKRAIFDGNRVVIELENSEGLFSSNLFGVIMYVADERRELKRASIAIEDDKLILTCEGVQNPTLVRYAFDNYYGGTHIYNSAGLPLQPFRTDRDGEDY
jgi:sialate O-acetylesterase